MSRPSSRGRTRFRSSSSSRSGGSARSAGCGARIGRIACVEVAPSASVASMRAAEPRTSSPRRLSATAAAVIELPSGPARREACPRACVPLVLRRQPPAKLSKPRGLGARRSRRLLSLRDTAQAMSQENVEITPGVRLRSVATASLRERAPDPDVESRSTSGALKDRLIAATTGSASRERVAGKLGRHPREVTKSLTRATHVVARRPHPANDGKAAA